MPKKSKDQLIVLALRAKKEILSKGAALTTAELAKRLDRSRDNVYKTLTQFGAEVGIYRIFEPRQTLFWSCDGIESPVIAPRKPGKKAPEPTAPAPKLRRPPIPVIKERPPAEYQAEVMDRRTKMLNDFRRGHG